MPVIEGKANHHWIRRDPIFSIYLGISIKLSSISRWDFQWNKPTIWGDPHWWKVPNIGYPRAGWFITEHPSIHGCWFGGTPILGNHHVASCMKFLSIHSGINSRYSRSMTICGWIMVDWWLFGVTLSNTSQSKGTKKNRVLYIWIPIRRLEFVCDLTIGKLFLLV